MMHPLMTDCSLWADAAGGKPMTPAPRERPENGDLLFPDIYMVDAHVHIGGTSIYDKVIAGMKQGGCRRMNLLSLIQPTGTQNDIVLHYKKVDPDHFYAFSALVYGISDVDRANENLEKIAVRLGELPRRQQAAGFDGFKLIESKPVTRRQLPWPLDGALYARFFAGAEEAGMPLLWHVGDPGRFWDPAAAPSWAKRKGWLYHEPGDVSLETLRREAENVVTRHPGLHVIFAHFFFMGDELDRARRFLKAHPNVMLDTTPGGEMYYQWNAQREAARDFFIEFQDRIVFGTDIGTWNIKEPALWPPERAAAYYRGMRVYFGTDALVPEDFPISDWYAPGTRLRGLNLPVGVLEKLFHGNFEKVAGAEPAAVRRNPA